MSISTDYCAEKNQLVVRVGGRFDFNLHRSFRDTYSLVEVESTRIIVDLAQTEYMDSSALGLLLVLRDKAGGDKSNIAIIHCNPEIRKIFSISNMDKLFKIS